MEYIVLGKFVVRRQIHHLNIVDRGCSRCTDRYVGRIHLHVVQPAIARKLSVIFNLMSVSDVRIDVTQGMGVSCQKRPNAMKFRVKSL